MNQTTNVLDGLDALLNGDDVNFDGLSNNTAYYTPASTTDVASAASTTPVVSTAVASPDPNAGESLINMIGLSALIYTNGKINKSGDLPNIGSTFQVNNVTYEVIDVENDASGYQGLTLFDKASKSIIVVNRGTQTWADIGTDGGMALRTASDQWVGAEALGSRVAALATQFGAVAIYTTGHSLGGTLTQMQATYFGWQGYAFNPYGAGNLYTTLGLAKSPNVRIYNYRTMFDLVSDASTQLGDPPITIETPQDVALLDSFYSSNLAAIGLDLLVTAGKDHSITNFYAPSDGDGDILSGGNSNFQLAPGFSLTPPSPQTLSLAEDMLSSLAELIHLGLEAIPGVGPFQSGDLTLQQSAEEVMQFIDNEPAAGIKTLRSF
jgi:hypothetical protein